MNIKIAYLHRSQRFGGEWHVFARRDEVTSAILCAPTRQLAVREAVRFIGEGDPLKALDMALDGLEELLNG